MLQLFGTLLKYFAVFNFLSGRLICLHVFFFPFLNIAYGFLIKL